MNTKTTAADLLTAADLADLLGISVTTLYSWRSHPRRSPDGCGGPPAYRVGRTLRWDATEVAAWLTTLREAS